jgi:hypothetical protein
MTTAKRKTAAEYLGCRECRLELGGNADFGVAK